MMPWLHPQWRCWCRERQKKKKKDGRCAYCTGAGGRCGGGGAAAAANPLYRGPLALAGLAVGRRRTSACCKLQRWLTGSKQLAARLPQAHLAEWPVGWCCGWSGQVVPPVNCFYSGEPQGEPVGDGRRCLLGFGLSGGGCNVPVAYSAACPSRVVQLLFSLYLLVWATVYYQYGYTYMGMVMLCEW